MAVEVHGGLYVGSEADCRIRSEDLAVVHACKSPCHQRFVGYRGSLPRSHPHYLVLRNEFDLVLNLIDPPKPLFMPESFSAFLGFANEARAAGRQILIHCNLGESRAPSLALLFLAKRVGTLPDESYEAATRGFVALYNRYSPGPGLQDYLRRNWRTIG